MSLMAGVVLVVISCTAGCQGMRTSFKVEAFGVSFGMAFSPERVFVVPRTNVSAVVTNVAN